MVNYQNTQLYELIEYDENGQPVVYRGHTTQPLHKRLDLHRRKFKCWKEGKEAYCSSFEVLKHGPARIEFVRSAPCFSKKEANREEGKFIRELPSCVNICKNYTRKDHFDENKTAIYQLRCEWRKKNKEKLKEKYLSEIKCECGSSVTYSHLNRHRNTWKHIYDFIHM